MDAHVFHQNETKETTEKLDAASGLDDPLHGLFQGQDGSRTLGGTLKTSTPGVHQHDAEESEEQPSGETDQEASSEKKQTASAHALKNFGRYRFHAKSLDELPFLKPTDGNISTDKWKGSEWTSRNLEEGSNHTHGNWSKGFRQRGIWVGSNGAGGGWMQEGIFNGFWSVTKSLGHRILEQFWTTEHHAQMNVTVGNSTAVFKAGNSTSANSTKEVATDDMARIVSSPDDGSMGP